MIVGGLALGLSVLGLLGNLVLGVAGAGGGARGRGGEDAIISAVSGVVGAIIGLAWGRVVFTGAKRVRGTDRPGMSSYRPMS